MRFFSGASSLRVQIRAGGLRPNPDVPGAFLDVPGDYAQFEHGQYDTSRHFPPGEVEDKVIAHLRKHPSYGYGKGFWAEVDRPQSERAEEELERLRAENAALKKVAGPQVVLVDRLAPANPAMAVEPAPAESGLQRLNRLKQEAAAAGITPKTTWKADDYERALSEQKGALTV